MKNFLGYAILLGTFFGMLLIGGFIVTGGLTGPVGGALTIAYALAGLFGMYLVWRKPKTKGFSPIYYDPAFLKHLVANTTFHKAEYLPLPVAEGKTIQIFDAGGHDETRQV